MVEFRAVRYIAPCQIEWAKSVSPAAWRCTGAWWALTSQRNTHFLVLLFFSCGLHLCLSSFPSSESRVAHYALREEWKWHLAKDPLLGLVKVAVDLWPCNMEERGFKRWLVTSHDCFSLRVPWHRSYLCMLWHWLYLPTRCNFWFSTQVLRGSKHRGTHLCLCQLRPSGLSWKAELWLLVIVIVCNFHKSSSETAHPQILCSPRTAVNSGGSPDPILSPKNSKQQKVLALHGVALCPIS